MNSHILRALWVAAALCVPALASSSAGEVKVLTAGAFKQVVVALVPDFERQTGNKVAIDAAEGDPEHHDLRGRLERLAAK